MCHRENRHLFLSSELEARLLAQSLPRHALHSLSTVHNHKAVRAGSSCAVEKDKSNKDGARTVPERDEEREVCPHTHGVARRRSTLCTVLLPSKPC